MTVELLNQISRDAMTTTLLVAGPVLIVSMVVGLVISLFQAVTQIQEFTLSFVPKIISVFLTIFLLLPWMAGVLVEYTARVFQQIPSISP